jgi:hypothetical protein
MRRQVLWQLKDNYERHFAKEFSRVSSMKDILQKVIALKAKGDIFAGTK